MEEEKFCVMIKLVENAAFYNRGVQTTSQKSEEKNGEE